MQTMQIAIRNEPLSLDIYGFSGIAINKDYVGTAFKLMDKTWQVVKSNQLANKGLNIWVYEPGEKVFSGVELHHPPDTSINLERKQITLMKYAWYKHVGPYQLIRAVADQMRETLKAQGHVVDLPYIEMYGHWTPDESQLVTELLMAVR